MATNFEKLQKLLEELFQLDQADLDFGIYKIMTAKRKEIVRFLEKDLLPQVKEAFGHYKSADKAQLQKELDKAIEQAKGLGVDPETTAKVKELREQMADSSVDVTALENEVFSHLYNFFRRYYHEGDFISLRRYKEGVYAIPYEGEEVKLYWANHDQYYVKSSEYFRDYTFKLTSGGRVHFKLVAASSEQDNKKEQVGKERRFIICAEDPIYEENGELYIRFEYRPDDGKKKQDALNQEAIERVLNAKGFDEWTRELSQPAPTKSNPKRTVLEKHLTRYTARNTFDYFIHKDLGGFLRRELDFYIKNEVMHLDDIEHDTVPRVEQYLSKIKVIRKIAHKIIQFLEQLENFQKKLWLKKKFVVETNYCITLDRVPEELYPEIAANDAQREEWVRLFAIDKINTTLNGPGYSEPLTVDFLKSEQSLVLDTSHFTRDFVNRLISSITDLDASCNGLVIASENSQALRLCQHTLLGKVRTIYIDPPYNTGDDGFMFKDSFRHSSWLSMMLDRLSLAHPLLEEKGLLYCSIDSVEQRHLSEVLNAAFGENNRVEEVIWVQNSNKNQSPTFSTTHEYVQVYARHLTSVKRDFRMLREVKPGFAEVQDLVDRLNPQYPPISIVENELRTLYRRHKAEIAAAIENGEDIVDEWKGLYNYTRAEYRTKDGRFVDETDAMKAGASIWIWREDNPSMPQVKEDSQKAEFRDPEHPAFRFYRPLHPVTGRPCPAPKRGWSWPYNPYGNQSYCFSELAADHRIAFGEDESKVPQTKRFLHEVETNVAKSVVNDFTDGEKELTNLFGRTRVFSNPKPSTLVERFCSQSGTDCGVVMDFFAGSGTTAQAVLTLNRKDSGSRKFILVEMGQHVDHIIKDRVKKIVYSSAWSNGEPITRTSGISHCSKYIRLESYEDALNNLELKRTDQQASLLEQDDALREQYILSYMLDVETQGSQSLLNVQGFHNPDQYKLWIERNGECQLVNVDLVETFNWLLGLTVKHIDVIRGVRVVEGTNPDGDRTLVLWRNLDETNNDALDEWFKKQDYNTKDQEYDLIYVNGDNNLENLRRGDQTWKVRLIEEEFGRLMFDVEGI